MNRETRRATKTTEVKTAAIPRKLEEINAEYTTLCGEAGQLQYNIKAFSFKLDHINNRISQLGEEGAERKKLDEAATPKAGA